MNRAERRRKAKAEKKFRAAEAKVRHTVPPLIVESHWRDVWHFDGWGLTVRNKATRLIVASYQGV